MNPTTSPLQKEFPLSPKKYWKKMFEKVIAWVVLAVLIIGFGLIIFVFSSDTPNSGSGMGIAGIIIAAALVSFGIIFAVYSWYVKKYIATYFYAGEEHFITIKKGVFAPAEIHVQWQKIQDVYVDQDIIDRIMGLYDVHIASATAASGIEAHIDGLNQREAEGLKEFLLDKVSNAGRGVFANNAPTSTISGGASVAGAAVAQQAAPKAQPTTFSFGEDISSDKYPLSGKWFAIKIIGRIFSTLVTLAILALVIFGEMTKSSKGVPVTTNGNTIVLYVYVGLAVLTSIAHIIGLFLWRKNYAFKFTPDNIFYREGMLSLSEKHMPYSSIQDVTVQQGVLERFVGLANVRVENAAQQMVQTRNGRVPMFSGVILQGLTKEDAQKITDMLKKTVLSRNAGGYGL